MNAALANHHGRRRGVSATRMPSAGRVRVADNGDPSLSDTKTFSVTVASRPVITAVRLVGGRIQLTWTSLAGQRYRLLYQSPLGTRPWTDLPGEVQATAASSTAEDASSLTAQRFYRVQVRP